MKRLKTNGSVFLFLLLFINFSYAQTNDSYTSYLTGSGDDLDVDPDFGICMMGGGLEHDEAMKWFLEKANGGDVVVLRASGSSGYNNYMYSQLGISLNSVETIVFHSAEAANDPYVIDRINGAEAIWLAGGDQYDYITYWKDTPVQDAINNLINVRGGAVGGTSAGMAILGQAYFTGKNGSVRSGPAMSNPYNYGVNLGWDDFIDISILEKTITDTHFNTRDRYGRLMVFLARMITDYELEYARGIAANEHVAVVIDEEGKARAYGDYPQYSDEFMYFVQTNCEVTPAPEIMQAGLPLTWNTSQKAVKAYKVPATFAGENYFDLTDWETGSGGEWENWYIESGTLTRVGGQSAPDCIVGLPYAPSVDFKIYPNPVTQDLRVEFPQIQNFSWQIMDVTGRVLLTGSPNREKEQSIDVSSLRSGSYIIVIHTMNQSVSSPFLKLR